MGESYIFSGSIIENITLNNKIAKEKIKKVLQDCEMDSDIRKLKKGYNTLIGEIVESGTHNEPIKNKKEYYKLINF